MGIIKIVKIKYIPTSDSERRLRKAIALLIRNNEAPSRKEFNKEKEILIK